MTPTPARHSPRAPGLSEAVGAFLLGVLLSGVLVQFAANAEGYRLGSSQPVPLIVNISSLVGLWAALLAGVVFFSRYRGTRSLTADLGLSVRVPFDLVVGTVVGLGSQLVLIPLMYLPFERADPTLRHRLDAPARSDTGAIHGGWQIAVLLLFFAVGAPIVEELFFRGLLLRSLSRWRGPAIGVVGSAVAFGLAHFELLQLPALIVFGLILGMLAQRTGRLGPGVVAHTAFNAIPVLSLTLRR